MEQWLTSFTPSKLADYGVLGILLLYFIWRDNTTLKQLKDSIQSLRETILILKEVVVKHGGDDN